MDHQRYYVQVTKKFYVVAESQDLAEEQAIATEHMHEPEVEVLDSEPWDKHLNNE